MSDKPLTPEERRALVTRPFVITTSGGRGWGGTGFDHLDFRAHGSRRKSVYHDSSDYNSTASLEGDYDADR